MKNVITNIHLGLVELLELVDEDRGAEEAVAVPGARAPGAPGALIGRGAADPTDLFHRKAKKIKEGKY